MKNLKRILLAMLVGCLLVGTAFFASCSKKKPDPEPGPDVTDPEPDPEPEPEPEPEPTLYTVTYSFGTCEGIPYAGTSTLPAEGDKEEGATFTMASALVWEGYIFKGWNDGTEVLQAGATYTMPAHNVTFTATWQSIVVTDTEVNLASWDENATSGGFTIRRGEFVKIVADLSYKETGDSAYGILAKIFPNATIDNNNFYQFRCDFAVKRVSWSWNETNNGFTVSDGGWNRDTYKNTTAGHTEITVSLSATGVLTYRFQYQETSGTYSHDRLFTDTVTMNSAYVIFGADHATTENVSIEYPLENAATLTFHLGEKTFVRHCVKGTTYSFEDDPSVTGAIFLGWKADGDKKYQHGETYAVSEDVDFTAVLSEKATVIIDKNGGTGSVYAPVAEYNSETGKYTISRMPNVPSTFRKTGFALKGWEVTVNGQPYTVEQVPFEVDEGAEVVFKAIWDTPYTVTYSLGSCEEVSYNGSTRLPTESAKAATVSFTLAKAPVWDGYTFLGWNDGTKTYEAETSYTMPAENVTLTAQWEKLPHYSVTFEGGSCGDTPYAGQNLIDEVEDMYAGAVFPLARKLEWAGYIFQGWSDGESTYAAMYRFTMPDHAVTFTAVWEKIPTHTVTYQANAEDVVNMPESTTYYEGEIVMTVPVRFGYTFKGWNDGENTYLPGEAIDLTSEDVTLAATWEELSEENKTFALLSGVWTYHDENGDVYLQISGTEGAWDAYKAFGTYKAGEIEIKSVSETQIKFTIHASLPAGSGTNNILCTYDIAKDTFNAGSYGSYTRTTEKPDLSSQLNSVPVALLPDPKRA